MKSSSTTIDNISLDRGVRQSRMTSFSGSEVYDVRRVPGSLRIKHLHSRMSGLQSI